MDINKRLCELFRTIGGSMPKSIFILLSIFTIHSNAQVSTQNFIKTWEATAPENNPNNLISRPLTDVTLSTLYSDGLSRPVQNVIKKGSLSAAGNTDLVGPVVYDAFGREAQKYLSYVSSSSDGLYKSDAITEQNNFYTGSSSPIAGQGENLFYWKTEFESSPLNRAVKIMAPGNNWVGEGRGNETQYSINAVADAVRIWDVSYEINDFGNYASSATYGVGELYKTIFIDENGKKNIQYKDKAGRVILNKVQISNTPGEAHTGWLCTYYLYDDFSRLRAVLPPKAVELLDGNWQLTAEILNELCFRYEFDEKGRMIMKKLPGAGAVYAVYDKKDLLIFTQDASMRSRNEWLTTLYDRLNRPVITGLITYNGSLSQLQDIVSTQSSTNSSSGPSSVINLDGLTTGTYQATNRINLLPGFQTFIGVRFAAQIVNGSAINGDIINGETVYRNYIPTGAAFEALTFTHYDDYNNLPAGLTSSINASGYAPNLNASSASPEYAEPIVASNAVKGMATWSKVRVLGTEAQYNSSTNIYDEKGRILQTQAVNITGGVDVVTNQYNFVGQVLRNHIKHQKLGGTAQVYEVATKNNYDALNRVSSIEKNINGTGWKTVSFLEYDALGQVKKKSLGTDPNNTNNPLEQLAYDYNIRGWLLGVNRSDVLTANGTSTRRFGFELGYDKQTNTAGRNYTAAQYNGNISGMIWKSAGDGIRRKYDFTYDAANRFMQGLFEQHNDGGAWDNATVNYNVKMGDGQDPTTAYDANGNIKKMQQWGLKGITSTQIDNLDYSYFNDGNKLKAVADAMPEVKLGDFTDKNTTATDYGYDKNGNLTTDLNKRINGNTGTDLTSGGAISYNYLNLPYQIAVKKDDGTDKGSISYTYDAAGNKLKKTVHEIGKPDKTTLYLFGTYEDDVLQFLPQEEGRIRYIPADVATNTEASFEWDYFIKDHLGNIRMVLTEENKPATVYQATMEADRRPVELATFGEKVNNTEYTKPPDFDSDNTNQKVANVNGFSTESRIGPGILLKVMAGDKVKALTQAWYQPQGADLTTDNTLNSIVNVLLNQMVPSVVSAANEGNGLQIDNSNIQPELNSFQDDHTPTSNAPKAYLNWVLLDEEQFKIVSENSNFEAVPEITGSMGKQVLQANGGEYIDIKKNGFLYVYVSNESKCNVYFDDIRVEHKKGGIMEETHYYPFGLTMAGISSKGAGTLENRSRFNSIVQTTELELNQYDAFYRNLDAQIGRFWQIDPKTTALENFSPYESMGNNPISNVDPLGDFKTSFQAWLYRLTHSDWWGASIHESPSLGDYSLDKVFSTADEIIIGSTFGNGNKRYDNSLLGRVVHYFYDRSWRTKIGNVQINQVDGSVRYLRESLGDELIGQLTFDYIAGGAIAKAYRGVRLLGAAAAKGGNTLYHYTSEAGYKAIMESGELLPSIGVKNARYGAGQYLTDIAPGQFTMGQTSRRLFGVPWNKTKLTHFIEIDVNGLNTIKNAPFNYMVPGTGNLPLGGRIVNGGVSIFK
jgi:RHS repeat-associated protein